MKMRIWKAGKQGSSIRTKYSWDAEYLVYQTKGWRWAFIKFLVRVLGVQAELDQAIVQHDSIASRRGQWQGLDKVLAYINTIETKTVKKSDIYHAVMEMRPE